MTPSAAFSPCWACPENIMALSSLRVGGVSHGCFNSFNLALHVGDDSSHVDENRRRLLAPYDIRSITWLEQIHSNKVLNLDMPQNSLQADGSYTTQSGRACVVMTADCLPVLMCDQAGQWVAAVHAGWRGLAQGILLNAIKSYTAADQLIAWLGPAISQSAFEVGEDVRQTFITSSSDFQPFFKAAGKHKWMADLYGIARYQLEANGVNVFTEDFCTYRQQELFFSYRRDGQTGRMASLIWLKDSV